MTAKTSDSSRSCPIQPDFEICESRLVLSAQALIEVLEPLPQQDPFADSIPIEPQLSEAHAATGLASVAQNYGLTGAGQTVAVIDTGIAWDHVALGQGYGPGYRVVGGWDFAENDDQPYDDGPSGFHGTHVAGVIGGDHSQHYGVASDVDLVSLRVFNDVGEGQLEWVESALRWVQENQHSFENPITTVNISIGTMWHGDEVPEWGSLEDELKELYDRGIVVTASAGNSFADNQTVGLSYPATSQYVLPVGSVDADGQLSDFSQRSDRILAAPGSSITSSVPDHVLGRDGRIDDFTPASGTSMASPYVAGASVLVRQAMELSGWTSINADTITDHLQATSDSVFDSITGQSYNRLNLEAAISSLLPGDLVGDTSAQAQDISFSTIADQPLTNWSNSVADVDVYRFRADDSGVLSVAADTPWHTDLAWALQRDGVDLLPNSSGEFALSAGTEYELHIDANGSIGPAAFEFGFEAQDVGDAIAPIGGVDLGEVDYLEQSVEAGASYSITAANTGTLTVQWNNPDASAGTLTLLANGQSYSSQDWQEGHLRVDLSVAQGQRVEFVLPGGAGDLGELAIANVVSQEGSRVTVSGTLAQDNYAVDLSTGLDLQVGSIEYSFATSRVNELQLDGYINQDRIDVIGSSQIERVNLSPGESSIENSLVRINIDGIELVSFTSGGGTDRVYLYDSDSDDVLRASPRTAELVGVGYEFQVEDVSRIFIHATGGGNDFAYLYDSPGDDQLSARPQFTSLKGDGFFNYVRGFERVYAYANEGGFDSAELYDSESADRFLTSGVSASVVGPGFSSYVRNFEQVDAIANAGGEDRATLYGNSSQTDWRQGSDFVSFEEQQWTREARGFEQVETYVDQQPFTVTTQSSTNGLRPASDVPLSEPIAFGPQQISTGGFPHEGHAQNLEVAEGELADELWIEALSMRELLEAKLHLPEEALLEDETLEKEALHAAFSIYGRQF